ncbi:LlaJI family restriction endonuclease [Proteus alimentorum]|uniref:LlaJI family restriction endonuclease n=1 Tax=Proteus alimentorum TaxID=1973495 RepID=A0ABS0IR48_9GAMM|nr:LlaJI family restriction endonuclease [Proteus alimentorum]MBG2876697.1 LlaJI family restriction endonuclease [Proteus alimentorum]MBG2878485.1 LlaJI family restriction endonuclease [Proteus alimentorum]
MSNLQFYRDRTIISQLPNELSCKMREMGLIAPDHYKVRFCGFFSCSGSISVFLPVNSAITDNEELVAHYLFQSLNRYYSDKLTGIQDTDGDTLIGGNVIFTSISLFEDYIKNGLYVRRHKLRSVNKGKTNWSRTISRHMPFISDSSPIYLDIESSQIKNISDSETARIQAEIIRDIKKRFGVLINGEEIHSDVNLEDIPIPSGDKETQLAHLNRELSLSYSERDINLIRLLKQYIENMDGTNNNILIIGTRHFQNVWESMLHKVLLGEKAYNQKLPVPYYLQNSKYHEVAEKGQRTDIIISDKFHQQIAVVDAKYYSALTPKDAPGWPDLVKQFFYEKAVKSTVNRDIKITTHFVFPGVEQKLISAHVGKRGQGDTHSFIGELEYPVIYCHYFDPIAVMEAYIKHKICSEFRKQIFNV